MVLFFQSFQQDPVCLGHQGLHSHQEDLGVLLVLVFQYFPMDLLVLYDLFVLQGLVFQCLLVFLVVLCVLVILEGQGFLWGQVFQIILEFQGFHFLQIFLYLQVDLDLQPCHLFHLFHQLLVDLDLLVFQEDQDHQASLVRLVVQAVLLVQVLLVYQGDPSFQHLPNLPFDPVDLVGQYLLLYLLSLVVQGVLLVRFPLLGHADLDLL